MFWFVCSENIFKDGHLQDLELLPILKFSWFFLAYPCIEVGKPWNCTRTCITYSVFQYWLPGKCINMSNYHAIKWLWTSLLMIFVPFKNSHFTMYHVNYILTCIWHSADRNTNRFTQNINIMLMLASWVATQCGWKWR